MSDKLVIDLGISQGMVWQLVIAERESGAVCLTRENPASESHFEGFHGYQSRRVHDCIVIPAEHRQAVCALLAPEPEPSEREIEAGAKALYDDSHGYPGALPFASIGPIQSGYLRQAKAVLAAARAARQTGGE